MPTFGIQVARLIIYLLVNSIVLEAPMRKNDLDPYLLIYYISFFISSFSFTAPENPDMKCL
jgi:hypothetical protein